MHSPSNNNAARHAPLPRRYLMVWIREIACSYRLYMSNHHVGELHEQSQPALTGGRLVELSNQSLILYTGYQGNRHSE